MARKTHREIVPVIVNNTFPDTLLGAFQTRGRTKAIFINPILLTEHSLRFHALETIIHEGRHAYQCMVIKGKISPLNFKAKEWKRNYSGYFSANEDKTLYSYQSIERDAQRFTIKMLKRLAFKYRNEEAFAQTLENNIARYEQAELDARKEFGLFYKHKINKRIKQKSGR
ncbi:MAG: hypothetical protein IJS68_02165 [Clostridia bacterium]|nr:hypothetical protein [Clostridia bacterium]